MKAVLRALAPGVVLSLVIAAALGLLGRWEQAEQERLRARCEALAAEASELEALAAKPAELDREVETLRGQLAQLRGIAPASAADAQRQLAEHLERRGVELVELGSEDAGPLSETYRWLRVKGRVRPVGRSGLEAFSDASSWPLVVMVESLDLAVLRDPEAELDFSAILVVGGADAAP